MSEFRPSKYQQKIFDYIKNGYGNCVISACAGSGKTTTIVKAIELVPENRKCLFIAFNKSIVGELKSRMTHIKNIKVGTFHSIGYSILRACRGGEYKLNLENYKYTRYIKSNIETLSDKVNKVSGLNVRLYINTIIEMVNLSRLYLMDSCKEINHIAKKYGLVVQSDECEVALKVLNWGLTELDSIDYTDMLWLPNILNLSTFREKYDFVFADECQDFSMASIGLLKKVLSRGSRFVAVGDPNQAINEFAGSTSKSFDHLCSIPNTEVYKLPISYRCPSTVIELAKELVDDIECRPNADIGSIYHNSVLSDVEGDDMVLCRNKATLIKVYNELITSNKKCYINGNDVGLSLVEKIKKLKETEIGSIQDGDGLLVKMYKTLFDKRDLLMETEGLDYEDATLSDCVLEDYDIIQCIEVLGSTISSNNVSDLIERIETIFKNEGGGICISTIHKAKGLERDNVFLYARDKLVEFAEKNQQEKNLLYVAYTRAKKNLHFLDENRYKLTGRIDNGNYLLSELKKIEETILGKTVECNGIIEVLQSSKTKERISITERLLELGNNVKCSKKGNDRKPNVKRLKKVL